ncbi:MAG TPA: hypothetical protein VEK36_00710 [Candidatus Paceibacterota bacterium]|nr:hypothetical protein [Candidatus Paceibacterota bacterium]
MPEIKDETEQIEEKIRQSDLKRLATEWLNFLGEFFVPPIGE